MTDTKNKSGMTTKEMVLAAMMTALIVICSWISIPASVPFTLQTFAVFCTVSLIGGRGGLLSILAYLLLGAVGVPVFAGMKGGAGVLFGPTGGYLLGFLLIPLIYMAAQKVFGDHMVTNIAAMLLGLLVSYTLGTAWFIHESTKAVTLHQALKWCVIPFVIPDIIKMVLAVVLSSRVKKYVK